MQTKRLDNRIAIITGSGQGIGRAIAKRFAAVNVESTEENRRSYRSLLFTAPGLGEYISGVILFDETLRQAAAEIGVSHAAIAQIIKALEEKTGATRRRPESRVERRPMAWAVSVWKISTSPPTRRTRGCPGTPRWRIASSPEASRKEVG